MKKIDDIKLINRHRFSGLKPKLAVNIILSEIF